MENSMPPLINVRGKVYKFSMFRIVSRNEQGRPEECVYIPDDRIVELADGDQFMTAYLPQQMTEPNLEYAEDK